MSSPYFVHHCDLKRMLARDTTEAHRAPSSLELFFDLIFVVAFLTIGAEYAHSIASGYGGQATIAFTVATLAATWAWSGYAWFASAFDNDDWLFRVLTLVQMVGLVVFGTGIPQFFASITSGDRVAAEVMIAGYVIMRVAIIAQWARVAKGSRTYRALAVGYIASVSTAQLGWIIWLLLPLPFLHSLIGLLTVTLLDLIAPIVIERQRWVPGGTPWHPHHLAERYSLLVIIALGETIIGTVAAARQITSAVGWTPTAMLVVTVGVAMAFTLWWTYFLLPSGTVLAAHRQKVYAWAYTHLLLVGSIVGLGAGLHTIGYLYDDSYTPAVPVIVTVLAVPTLLFTACILLLQTHLVSRLMLRVSHIVGFSIPVLAIGLAVTGSPLWVSLLLILAAPLTVLLAYELGGWRTLETQLHHILQHADTRTGGPLGQAHRPTGGNET